MKPFKSRANVRVNKSVSTKPLHKEKSEQTHNGHFDTLKPLQVLKSRKGASFRQKQVNLVESETDIREETNAGTSRANAHDDQCGTTILGKIPALSLYVQQLRSSKLYFSLTKDETFAIAECDDNGSLNKSFSILERLRFIDELGHSVHLLVCSCDCALEQKERLFLTNRQVTEKISVFMHREKQLYCVHAKAADIIDVQNCQPAVTEDDENDEYDSENDESVAIDQLSVDPVIVAVFDGLSYGVLSKEERSKVGRIRCRTCRCNVHMCSHVRVYQGWCIENDVDIETICTQGLENTSSFESISTAPIPYPLTNELKIVFDDCECGRRQFPQNLVPNISKQSACIHGNDWDQHDPVEKGWLLCDNVTIHIGPISINRTENGPYKLYFIPTVGYCDCNLHYDGQSDLLFNLDNKHMFYYGFLFSYLHVMIEGRNPLAAFHRATQRSCSMLSMCNVVPYDIFRRGWNAFARLLNISWTSNFKCDDCGDTPYIVICDGTFLGMRKDLIQPFMPVEDNVALPPIHGTRLKDRVVIPSAQTRKLLQRYSGKIVIKGKRGLRKIGKAKELTKSEFNDLLRLLEKEVPPIASLVKRLTLETTSHTALPIYQTLFYELSLSTPAVGFIQIGGDTKAIKLLRQAASNILNIFESSESSNLAYLRERTPLLCNFLSSVKNEDGNIPHDTGQVIELILTTIEKCFSMQCENTYPRAIDDKLSFFPCLPQKHGYARYEADIAVDASICRKESYKHPMLTPGIFTVFCPHGICYGFQAMTSCESPRVPFSIFKTRFKEAPSVIIYDNACNLHRYCLNREPLFFQSTRFYVDSFHWKGHVSCSEGYCLDLHRSTINTIAINSQINEQANAGLKRLQSQLTYMSAENFMFHISLFLALKNMDKNRSTCKSAELEERLKGLSVADIFT